MNNTHGFRGIAASLADCKRAYHLRGLSTRALNELVDEFARDAARAGLLSYNEVQQLAACPKPRPPLKRRPGRRNRRDRAAPRRYCVAVYRCDRDYGGPEEGGWWYDCGYRVGDVETFFNKDHALARRDDINARLDAEQEGNPRAHLGSVLCTGRLVAEMHRGTAPSHYPTHTPHYE